MSSISIQLATLILLLVKAIDNALILDRFFFAQLSEEIKPLLTHQQHVLLKLF